MNVTIRNTRDKLLTAAGASWSMPSTRAGIDKRLGMIADGKGLRRPDTAHPYRECFEARKHDHYACGKRLTCQEYIAAVEAHKLEARATA